MLGPHATIETQRRSRTAEATPGGDASAWFAAWFLWVAFVVYGSLVPLAFVPKPLDEALAQFLRLPMLDIGVQGRADWIANGVLYLPVGFLTAGWAIGHRHDVLRRLLAVAGAIGFGIALAVAVEFTQVFFPQRTVSMNDVMAESIGTVLGAVAAPWWSPALRRLMAVLRGGLPMRPGGFFGAYLAAYVALSLFPYDLLLSQTEFADKLASDLWGWLIASSSAQDGWIRLSARVAAEGFVTVPLGLLWASRFEKPSLLRGMVVGASIGIVIETAQIVFASGVSQGISAAARTIGFVAGVAIWRHRDAWRPDTLRPILRHWTLPLSLAYLLVLLAVSGWFSSGWDSTALALERLRGEVRFIPFYYHYYTSEAKALFSLMSVALLYLPIGALGWLRGAGAAPVGWLAVGVALCVEAGKLFHAGTHPDPTNALVAGAAAAGTCALIDGLSARFAPAATNTTTATGGGAVAQPRPGRRAAFTPQHAVLVALVAFGAGWLSAFPLHPLQLGTLLLACGAVVWRWPIFAIAAVPAALPWLDLAPWSGRFFFDEFDAWVLTALVVGYCRTERGNRRTPDPWLAAALVLLTSSLVVSLARALWPWSSPDLNAFNNYLSPFNALRIGKGALWALLFCGLARRFMNQGRAVVDVFAAGMVIGLGATVAFVVWERAAFGVLFDVSTPYRVSGPISAMHIGGAYLDSVLVTGAAFLAAWLFGRRHPRLRGPAALLMLATAYAVLVTFTRSTWAAFALVIGLVLLSTYLSGGLRGARAIGSLAMLAAVSAVAYPILSGSFASSRIEAVGRDLQVREAAWNSVLALRKDGAVPALFGMGLGTFPAAHFWSNAQQARTGSYDFGQDNDRRYLSLGAGAGAPIYIDQAVDLQPGQPYRLRLTARAAAAGGQITVGLCHKWLLTSFDCVARTIDLTAPPGAWAEAERQLDAATLGVDPWYARRPVRLSLFNPGAVTVDIDQVSLAGVDGQDILRNGSFDRLLDHWTFTSDDHLAWHTKSLVLGILFDQGGLGLLAFGLLIGLALYRSAGATRRGSVEAGTLAGALSGFLLLGLFDTMIDMPRYMMLLIVIAWLAAARPGAPTEARR